MSSTAEPWLRGTETGVHACVAPTLFAYQQAREDLARWTEGFSDEQMWMRPHGLAPLAFQIRHIAGSVERLTTYVQGRQLSEEQVRAVSEEQQPAEFSREALLGLLDT